MRVGQILTSVASARLGPTLTRVRHAAPSAQADHAKDAERLLCTIRIMPPMNLKKAQCYEPAAAARVLQDLLATGRSMLPAAFAALREHSSRTERLGLARAAPGTRARLPQVLRAPCVTNSKSSTPSCRYAKLVLEIMKAMEEKPKLVGLAHAGLPVIEKDVVVFQDGSQTEAAAVASVRQALLHRDPSTLPRVSNALKALLRRVQGHMPANVVLVPMGN